MRKKVWQLVAFVLLAAAGTASYAQTQEPKPVFELDCISFAGRFLDKAPSKKKVHPGMAADGTAWSLSQDGKHIVVTRVFPGEAAEKSGVEPGDEILSVNGYPTDVAKMRDVFCAYHLYDPANMTEALSIQKKDGTKQTLKLQLLSLEKCAPEEKRAWLDTYKFVGY